ncbi:zeta toxin family protein [Rhodoferax sp.]|uniref:zeta toxin family protein n=1 Tax=Rhodoferax sp. TaxID=50421 RepID=UPI00374DAECF
MKPARVAKPKPPTVVVIAGPNGAGKSTAAPFLLKQALGILEFVNADQIAVGLSAYAPEKVSFEAGRIMLKRLHELAASKGSFAFESTLSSRTFALFLSRCKAQGYQIQIFYVALPSAALAVNRVALRVKLGGHNIPQVDIERRFQRSLHNLYELYLPLADRWTILDNASGTLKSIAHGTARRTYIKESEQWLNLKQLAQ